MSISTTYDPAFGATPSLDLASSTRPTALLRVVVDGGPDTGAERALDVGSHVVGRAGAAAISVADPGLELHHARFTVAAGRVTLVQLAGRGPWNLERDGSRRAGVDGERLVGGDVVTLGATRLRLVGRGTAASPDVADRVPPFGHDYINDNIDAGAPAVALGWYLPLAGDDPAAWCARVAAHRRVDLRPGAAAVAELAGGRALSLTGPGAPAVGRQLVAALAGAGVPPAVLVVVDEVARWASCTGLGRTAVVAAAAATVAATTLERWRDHAATEHVVVVCDRPSLLDDGAALGRVVDEVGAASVVVSRAIDGDRHDSEWRQRACVSSRFTGRFMADGAEAPGLPVHFTGRAPTTRAPSADGSPR